MIKITRIGVRGEPVDIKVNTCAKFRYGTRGDISFWLELDGNNIYTTYSPSLNFTVGSFRLAAITKLLEDMKKMPDIDETRKWKGCGDIGFYDACFAQAKSELCNPLYSNRARELKEEIIKMVRKRRSPLELSLDTLERLFDKYENFTTPQTALELEAGVWRTEVNSYQENEDKMCENVCRKLKEYIGIRNNILGKTVRSEHLFTVNIDE